MIKVELHVSHRAQLYGLGYIRDNQLYGAFIYEDVVLVGRVKGKSA